MLEAIRLEIRAQAPGYNTMEQLHIRFEADTRAREAVAAGQAPLIRKEN